MVASEVQALAQRSSDAAMEIKTLIGDSSRQVEQGVDLVGRAGEALHSIVSQVGHISQLVSEIALGATAGVPLEVTTAPSSPAPEPESWTDEGDAGGEVFAAALSTVATQKLNPGRTFSLP